jgi:hypothetical protein
MELHEPLAKNILQLLNESKQKNVKEAIESIAALSRDGKAFVVEAREALYHKEQTEPDIDAINRIALEVYRNTKNDTSDLRFRVNVCEDIEDMLDELVFFGIPAEMSCQPDSMRSSKKTNSQKVLQIRHEFDSDLIVIALQPCKRSSTVKLQISHTKKSSMSMCLGINGTLVEKIDDITENQRIESSIPANSSVVIELKNENKKKCKIRLDT